MKVTAYFIWFVLCRVGWKTLHPVVGCWLHGVNALPWPCLQDLNNSSLPPFVKRWLSCYIHGRQSKVNFRGKTSKSRNVRTGVPQGAVTSPILFNFYLTKLPTPPQGIKIIQYADDISIYTCGTSITKMAHDINMFITEIIDFLEERGLTVSPEKSTVTLFTEFTRDTHEYKIHPDV